MFSKLKFVIGTLLIGFITQGNAQSVMFGGGSAYGSEINQFALNFRMYYGVNEAICFGPEFSSFFTVKEGESETQLNEYGFVAHYIFEVKEKLGLYPLVGLNYSIEKDIENGTKHISKALGAAFGFGAHFNLNHFLPFIEYKFITGDLSQSTFSFGLVYNLHFNQEGKAH